MTRTLYLLTLAAAMLVSSAFAKPAKPAPKPLSDYMRRVGILYLEQVEELTTDCDSDCKGRWSKAMDGIQDRIEITLSESKRPSGDKPFYELLRSTRWARNTYVESGPDTRKAWSSVYIRCSAYAHTVAKEGELFDGDGGCDGAIAEASK